MVKLLISINRKSGREPLIARTVLETGVLINVERAHIESMTGQVLVDVPAADADEVIAKLKSLNAGVEVLEEAVRRDEQECVECGACVSVCPQEVISFDEDWHLCMKTENCVLCGKCVEACPHNALSLRK